MTAPVLEWTYRVGYPETDVLTTTDDVLVTALVRRYGGRWAVELWTSRDDEDDAPEHRLSRAILDIDVPRADPIPPAVLVAAEAWLREHVRSLAWPAEEQPTPPPAAQREPVAGWLCEGGDNSYLLGDVEVFRYCDVWWYRVGARIRVGPHAGLRDAKLAAEDAAAEVLRARVEALGYRMVRP